jgi:hypothetical protein
VLGFNLFYESRRSNRVSVVFSRIPVISVFAVRVTPIFTSKVHALNTLKMAPLLRSDVMLS